MILLIGALADRSAATAMICARLCSGRWSRDVFIAEEIYHTTTTVWVNMTDEAGRTTRDAQVTEPGR